MASIGLVTDIGNTEAVGEKIAYALRQYGYIVDMVNVSEASEDVIMSYPFLIFGIPTRESGGVNEEWEEFEETLSSLDLSDRVIALYGLGNQQSGSHYFVDAMGWLYERIIQAGAEVVGHWSTDGYHFKESLASNKAMTEFCGLAIDDGLQCGLTDKRVTAWVNQIIDEYEQWAIAL